MFRIIVLGDSISFGIGEPQKLGWAGRLKNHFEAKGFYNCLFNLGVPGDSTIDLLKRFETEIKSRVKYKYPGDKFVVMIAIGINDLGAVGHPDKPETTQKEFKENISKLVKIAKKYTKNVIIVGITPVDEDKTNPFENTYFTNKSVEEYNNVLKIEAKNNKVHYIHLFSTLCRLNHRKLLFDGVHPNKNGYNAMYKIIKNFLIKKKLIS